MNEEFSSSSHHLSRDEQELFSGYVENRLDPQQSATLDHRLRDDDDFRRRFAEALHLEGVLRAEADELFAESASTKVIAGPFALTPAQRGMAAAALLAIGLALGWLLGPAFSPDQSGPAPETVVEAPSVAPEPIPAPAPAPTLPEPVATLADVKSAKWGSSSLPTQEGSRLRPGQLELLEGLATLRFDSGVTVTLEAPAAIDVKSAMLCRLQRGAAVAWVPQGAEGFQIETEDALLTDYGTRFGVTAGRDGKSEVLVLEGEVGVTHRKGDSEKRLKQGEMVRYDAEELVEASVGDGETLRFKENEKAESEGWISLTTGRGRGKDTYARLGHDERDYGDAPLLMVKHSTDHERNRRKAWLTFDLQRVDKTAITESELALSIQPSGLGYASMVPDSTFAVYGLLDESADESWRERSLNWENAPANVVDHGFRLQEDKVQLLGEFTVEQGVSSGVRSVEGGELTDFLLSDTNGLVTFIVVRITDESGGHGLVHAFASAEHPVAMPPTLRLKVK